MRFAPPEEALDLYKTGFENDLLGRKKVGQRLSEVLQRTEDPLVVALDGRWGTGKSHFLQRWVGEHLRQYSGEANTLYFDAFAHDYLSDPLVALVGALSERLPEEESCKLDRVKKVTLKLLRPAARIGLALATYGATAVLNELGDAAAKAVENEAGKAVEEFWEREEGRQAAMEEFRKALGALTAAKGGEAPTPLIIVVDELDRCRPDYALEILEVIKHFFAVPHVHFVLGANLEALENSVKARYGAGIDATAYLQKFLSFTVTLPEHVGDDWRTSAMLKYADHLGRAMKMPDHLLEEVGTQLRILSRNNSISLRDVGKVMSMVALLPEEAQAVAAHTGLHKAAVTLVITRIIRSDIFPKLCASTISPEELVAYLGAGDDFVKEYTEDDRKNPKFDGHVLYLYRIWMNIFYENSVDKKFLSDDVFGCFNIKEIPVYICKNWLSNFRLPD
ncbi:P-loop NTPase fold protein [Rhodobacteraceae bacterium DSL-40]|uniref:KAP family P-loop NTPase fold protein n=1 Tax=Amaricoccus sp. B4 TaxID=3368557 RepID=UPI000DABD5E3